MSNDFESVNINFTIGNAAFDDSPTSEISRILRDIADRIEAGQFEKIIRDLNGNTIGQWSIKSE